MRKFLKAALIFSLLFGLASNAKADPEVLSVAYACPDTQIHIGSEVTIYMSVGQVVRTLDLTVLSATSSNVVLEGADLATIPTTTLLITDGIRTWQVAYSMGQPSITIDNFNLLRNAVPLAVTDYITLQNQVFRVYQGNVVSAASGSSDISVDIGSFDSQELEDNGLITQPLFDDSVNDGVWTGVYRVRDQGFAVQDARLYGHAIVGGVIAGNEPFQSSATIDIDMIRPEVLTYSFTTNKPSYRGLLYLSSQSMGSTVETATNGQGRFDLTVNKRNVIVDVVLSGGVRGVLPVPMTPRNLDPVIIPDDSTNLNGWRIWKGRDGNNVFVEDAVYDVTFYIRDSNGVVGLTKTTQVKVTSLQIKIENVILTPSAIPDQPVHTDTLVTITSWRTVLENESGTSIRDALTNLGFPSGGSLNDYTNMNSLVFMVPEIGFYAPNGDVIWRTNASESRDDTTNDTDEEYLKTLKDDPRFTLPNCYGGLATGASGTTNLDYAVVDIGDGDVSNDWDIAFRRGPFFASDFNAPVQMSMTTSFGWRGSTPPTGSYRVEIRAMLTGMNVEYMSVTPDAPDVGDFCAPPDALDKFYSLKRHFYPSGLWGGSGLGIFVEDTSTTFVVSYSVPPTSDNSPPEITSTDPADGGTEVAPNVYGRIKNFTAWVTDPESPINVGGSVSFLRIKNPLGAYVGGISRTNGGTSNNSAQIIFEPFNAVTVGGDYIMEVHTCNIYGLCMQKDIAFTVKDTSAPDVVAVYLKMNTQINPESLTLYQTSPDGPYSNVTEVHATLSMAALSTNIIDWDRCDIILERVSGTTRTNIPLTRLTALGSVPGNWTLEYKLASTITDAALYEVTVNTYATTGSDGSGDVFSGPSTGFVNPQFTSIVDSNIVAITYPNGVDTALFMSLPVTITSGAINVTPDAATIGAVVPDMAAFTAVNSLTGYLPITSSAENTHAVQFNIGSGSLYTGMVFNYSATTPVRLSLHFDEADLPVGVTSDNLRIYGWDGSAWNEVTTEIVSSIISNATDNYYTIQPPNGSSAYAIYGMFFASEGTSIDPVPTVTPLRYTDTKSFNPTDSNLAFRAAKIYYSAVPVTDLNVKVYDTAGTLVRDMGSGTGLDLSLSDIDLGNSTIGYYFNWDGKNGSGEIVKNGIYLVRYKYRLADGSQEVATRVVALIQ